VSCYLQFIDVARPVFMLRVEDVVSSIPGPYVGISWPVPSGGGGQVDNY
jgi:hypothetical protein